jgi:hypothetical protein
MTWRMSVKSGKSSSGSPICSGLHSAAESAPVLVSPSGATAAGDRGRRRADVESGVRRDGRPRVDVPPSEPFGPDDVPSFAARPAPTATDTPGRFCSRTAARTSSRARSTAAAYCGDGAESMTDGTSCGCGKRGAVTRPVGQKCRERGDDDADGKRGAGGPGREPVARGPHTEHDPPPSAACPMTAAPGASSAPAT